VLAWVSARYTLVLFDPEADITGGLCIALGALYLCLAYAINVLSPRIAGRFQIATTLIKLLPLAAIVLIGTVVGLINGNTTEAFAAASVSASSGNDFSGVLAGVAAATFAYDGWIIATSINAELKEPKKNLPIALIGGTALIMLVYILYFIGLTGGATVDVLRQYGAPAAFRQLFGAVGGTLFNACIVISCLGTLNGLMLACTRALYSLSVRSQGPRPQMFSQLDAQTNMPVNSGVLALVFCAAWFFYFYAANLTEPVFGVFSFDSSELPIISIYAIYIPIFVAFIRKEGKTQRFKNVVMPILAIVAAAFMIFVAFYAHGIRPWRAAAEQGEFAFPVLFYLIVFAAILSLGALWYRKHND
jgi:APA family basic amino acid/polyamine antiporter